MKDKHFYEDYGIVTGNVISWLDNEYNNHDNPYVIIMFDYIMKIWVIDAIGNINYTLRSTRVYIIYTNRVRI